jgi:ATP/maltotriose-dependent transcriptional regulator MalT
MLEPEDAVQRGRGAYAQADWKAARDAFTQAHSAGSLGVDDLALLGRAAWWLGDVHQALSLSEEVFAQYCAVDRTRDAAMTALQLSLLWMTRGDLTVGAAWLARARRLLADLPEDPGHGYLIYLETSMSLDGHAEPWAAASVDRLRALAASTGDPALASLSDVASGMAALRRGDTDEGFERLDEAMLPVLAGRVAGEWAGDVYCTIIHVCHELADFQRMEDWTAATERWCTHFGSDAIYTGICRVHRLELLSARGEWAHAEARIARESQDLLRANPWVASEGFYQLGEIHRLRGDSEAAREAFAAARRAGSDAQPGAALLDLADGHTEEAWRGITDALDTRDQLARARLLRSAVEIALAAGRLGDAEPLGDELREAASRYATRGFRAWAAHVEGMLALTHRDHVRALDRLNEAESLFRLDRLPYDTADALVWIARTHRASGDDARSRRAIRRAREILAELGAAAEFATLGENDGAIAPAAATTFGPLTTREAEVLACVASGASNRDVAARLYISEKTVGRHLANIYAKLDVGTRTAAAAWWHAHGRPHGGAAHGPA